MSSDFLFAGPSFLSGVSRSLDLTGQFNEYNGSPSDEIADWFALLADWRVVGGDLVTAMMDDAVPALDRHVQTQPQEPTRP